jgi:hypothetical protein
VAVTPEAEKAHQEPVVESEPSVHGKDVVLVVGWDGNSHRDIDGIEGMVRENREEYVAYHGTPRTNSLLRTP